MKVPELLDLIAPWPTGSPGRPDWLAQAQQARDTWRLLGAQLAELEGGSPFVRAVGEALLSRPRVDERGGGFAWNRYMMIATRPAVVQELERALRTAPVAPGELAGLARSSDDWWAALGRLALSLRGVAA